MRTLFAFVGFIVAITANAQVQNNSFKDRIHLIVDDSLLHSSTAKSTVEWECVNKALTNTCLVYHNDQWFYFSLETAGDYYLNILDQKCRDKRGVQVLIIEGNPCETKDYRILECVSKGLQNDVFIPLMSLKANTPYLINIDGFLGDYCDFTIQIATKPLGLPLKYDQKDTVAVKTIQHGKLVEIRWVVPTERIDLYNGFKVYRKNVQDKRSSFIREMMIERNTYGQPSLQYSFMDTLKLQGDYGYSIFGIHKETLIPILVSENKISYYEKKTVPKPASSVVIPIQNLSGENFDVIVYDQTNLLVLTKYKSQVDLKSPRQIEVDLEGFITKGLRSFMILISDPLTAERNESYYKVETSGKIIKE